MTFINKFTIKQYVCAIKKYSLNKLDILSLLFIYLFAIFNSNYQKLFAFVKLYMSTQYYNYQLVKPYLNKIFAFILYVEHLIDYKFSLIFCNSCSRFKLTIVLKKVKYKINAQYFLL